MNLAALLCFVLLAAQGNPPQAEIPYFSDVREVHVASVDRQNFFVVDQELWAHARPDLGDLRLYDGETPVQYMISEQFGGVSSEEVTARILDLGTVAGHTEFDLDMQGLSEYDRIRLRLDAHDFVAKASVSGGDAPGNTPHQLESSTLYDFTKEHLGSNSTLRLPLSSFRYMHIVLSAGIRPDQVTGATIANVLDRKASWTNAGSCSAPQQKGRTTEVSCEIPAKVPVNRILFSVEPTQINFRRTVSVEDDKGTGLAAGEISRVRVNRAGTLVTNEELAISVVAQGNRSNPTRLTLVIDNGDNSPLAILDAEPQSLERRVYFDPQEKSTLKLYYGDEKLVAPVYDYARFFHLEDSPAEAQLAPSARNPQYSGRPDERPWSERHTGILWAAMILVVLGLAVIAFRGFRTEAPK